MPKGTRKTTQRRKRGRAHSADQLGAIWDGWEKVVTGDCRLLLPEMGAYADLIFADPPFNMGRDYDSWDDNLEEERYWQFTLGWMRACLMVLNKNGSIWVNIPSRQVHPVLAAAQELELHMNQWCIWHYRFGQWQPRRFTESHCHAIQFCRFKERNRVQFHAAEVAAPTIRQLTGDPRAAGERPPLSVWGFEKYWGRVQGNNKERDSEQDNQLPEVYVERVIRACSKPVDLVVDPFCGSGTTGAVARALGRRFWGCDISRSAAARTRKRIKEGARRVRTDS